MTGYRQQAVDEEAQAWAASGLRDLSGPAPGGTCGPPARLVGGVADTGRRIEEASGRLRSRVTADWLRLLTQRAHRDGTVAGGRVSCGGSTQLLACNDGWVAVSLARPSDVDLVPAWLALAGSGNPQGGAEQLAAGVRQCRAQTLVEAATLVGLPASRLGECSPDALGGVIVHPMGPAPQAAPVRVVDLSALWAGPLCTSLLASAGCDVVKVVSSGRPDRMATANTGPFDQLNGRTAQLELDLAAATGRAELAKLIASATVVVEASRPRALEQMGIMAAEVMGRYGGPQVWVAISGHGREAGRVAFGDDAAVAGGLVVHTKDGPWFCGDAVADPLTGLAAAATVLELLVSGRRALVDVSMAAVAAAHAGPTLRAAARSRPPPQRADGAQ